MKTHLFFLGLILLIGIPFINVQAHHLDGLWRNDHENISLKIETTNEGMKAKRLDQAIWYFYTVQEYQYYVNRNGDYYEFLDDENIIWRQAETRKSILFKRSDDHYRSGWNGYSMEDDRWNDHYGNGNGNRNNDHVQHWNPQQHSMQGFWYSQDGNHQIQIQDDHVGIRVRRSDGRWIYFEEIDKNEKYRNRQGDTIRRLNDHRVQWKNKNNGTTIVFRN